MSEQIQEYKSGLVLREEIAKQLTDDPDVIKKNKFADNTDYVPISEIEGELDKLFGFDGWQLANYTYQVVANEVIGTIELAIWSDRSNQWIRRTGSAAVMIRQKKDADITDISAKIKNALTMDFPHLESMCLKSAAKKFGKRFGRDLNRDYESIPPSIDDLDEKQADARDKAEKLLLSTDIREIDSRASGAIKYLKDAGLPEKEIQIYQIKLSNRIKELEKK